MRIRMTLLSDTIFGNGESIPGAEDISTLFDQEGFPYYKGGTLKGIFREELTNYLIWNGDSDEAIADTIGELLGNSGDSDVWEKQKLRFSDLTLSEAVKEEIRREVPSVSDRRELFTFMRTFTAIGEEGVVKKGSLRTARCLAKGLVFYGTIEVPSHKYDSTIRDVLGLIKGIGTMRNRGFGQVRIERAEED